MADVTMTLLQAGCDRFVDTLDVEPEENTCNTGTAFIVLRKWNFEIMILTNERRFSFIWGLGTSERLAILRWLAASQSASAGVPFIVVVLWRNSILRQIEKERRARQQRPQTNEILLDRTNERAQSDTWQSEAVHRAATHKVQRYLTRRGHRCFYILLNDWSVKKEWSLTNESPCLLFI